MNATQEVHATPERTESKNGRHANGRFAPGNPGGPGNPHYRKVAEYKKAMLAFVTIEDLGRIIAAMKKKAEGGDVAAARLILQYTLGKPSVDPDLVDVDEWQKLQQHALPPREMQVVLNGVPASLATRLTNIAWPCYLDTASRPFREGLKKLDERDAKRAAAKAKKASAAAAPKANGANSRVHEPAAPTPDASIGRVPEPAAPKANGDNGRMPGTDPVADWWEQALREEMERIRREEGWPPPSPDGDNGGPAPGAA
ncbi:MAG TPA: hypothetical protein VKE94_01095 [Gemmataceae bacterium]|nr:hypothetical protein [Gemmataceae bacterium]